MTIMICLYYIICLQEANYVGLSLISVVVVVVVFNNYHAFRVFYSCLFHACYAFFICIMMYCLWR